MSYWPNGKALNLTPIKHLCRLNADVLQEDTDPDLEFDYVDIGSVTLEEGIKQKGRMRFEIAPSRARKPVRIGDVIVSTVRTYLKAVARIDQANDGAVVSTGFAVLRPRASVEPNFLYRLCQSNPFVDEVQARSAGVSYPAINPSALAAIKVPFPDLDTQKTITAFLDRKTLRIDNLIEKKERQVALLDQHACQTVSESVTGQTSMSGEGVATGLDYLPRIPPHWILRRAGLLFKQMAEPNTEELPVLSVSIHHGISDRQLDDDERDRKINLIEDRTSYKRVRPGYLAYNMMRAWQGAVGVSLVEGAVSPAYVVAKPTQNLHSPYYQFLLRTPPFSEQRRQRSKGITDFRLRLYWEQFRQIVLPVPPLSEQMRIATQADRILSQTAKLTEVILASVEKLRERRAALITAAVAGEIDVRGITATIITMPDRTKFRLIVGAEVVHRHQGNSKFGRVKLQKVLYLAETHAGIAELQGNYLREAAGPFDRSLIDETERELEAKGFYRKNQPGGKGGTVTYTALSKAGQHAADIKGLLGPRADALRDLINVMSEFETESVEAIATLYAVWNDAMLDGQQPDDAAIIKGFLTEWHVEKGQKFKEADLRHWLDWMRRNNFIPRGQGPRTAHTMTRDMFS
jgi:restriction endonuclease S subunit